MKIAAANTLFLINILLVSSSNGVKLDRDGGYSITLGIVDGTAEPTDSSAFLSTIEDAIKELSELMWSTTDKFYIRNLDIITPHDWKLPASPVSTSPELKSYHTSDIRIGPLVQHPQVINKNQCGRPGEYMEFPSTFFQEDSEYGPKNREKSLLHDWARLRWGVWEEHGHPGDSRFPYFYKKDLGAESWNDTTGCSDVDLIGKLVHLYDPAEDACKSEGPFEQPNISCRFVVTPEDTNTALTSLMHFPWVKSVNHFCDDTNHNKKAPSRHNVFCGYRSTREVIDVCEDALHVDTPPGSRDLTTTHSKSTKGPLLKILLDRGINQLPPSYLVRIKAGLKDLFDGRIPDSTRVSFQYLDKEANPSPPTPKPDWATIGEKKLFFDRFINDHEPNVRGERECIEVIDEAVEQIYKFNPVNGGVVVVLKLGAKVPLDSLLREQDLVNKYMGRPVKIFAIEMQESLLTPRVNLEGICWGSGGRHLRIKKDTDVEAEMAAVINGIEEAFKQPTIETSDYRFAIYKEYIQPDTDVTIFVQPGLLELTLTTVKLLYPDDVTVLYSNGSIATEFIFESVKEWSETGSQSRNILRAIGEYNQEIIKVQYKCSAAGALACSALLVVFGQEEELDIQMSITTSARDGEVDFKFNGLEELNKQFPLSIFAEISENGTSLKDVNAEALVRWETATGATNTAKILLRNNGQAPDLFKDDGIYSGVFVPPDPTPSEEYSINVHFTYEPKYEESSDPEESYIRFLPVNQTDWTCGDEEACSPSSKLLNRTMARSWDLIDPVTFKDFAGFVIAPAPILDLTHIVLDEYEIQLEWTAPYIIGSSNLIVESYNVCRASSPDELLKGTTRDCTSLESAGTPGERKYFKEEQKIPMYYAIVSIYKLTRSLSNIVGVSPAQKVPTTTTTERPTTTRRTTTTRRPTSTESPIIKVSHGYNIVVAIDEDSPFPDSEDAEEYIQGIKEEMKTLSEEMFVATESRFYIESVNLVIPSSWTEISDYWNETAYSVRTADIRLSSKFQTPRVENPNPCGLPGSYMELPYSFFNSSLPNPYGEKLWKTLLHQWARYKWGVWEEHGYVGSRRFPYFHRRPYLDDWEATGCSFPTLKGEITNNADEACPVHNDLSPDINCRFKPHDNSQSESSLMYLHWVDSINQFCTNDTHDMGAPTKQNVFCRHRSVLEIIHSSLDLQGDTPLLDKPPEVIFNISKTSPYPVLYVLLDDGQTTIPEDFMPPIREYLVNLVQNVIDQRLPENSLIGIGRFPSTNSDGPYVEEMLKIMAVNSLTVNFPKVFSEFPSRVEAFRDFGLAIRETINNLKKWKLDAGAIILVVKTGVQPNIFDKMSYEEEIVATIRTQNIKIFGLELRPSALRPATHLEYLAKLSKGRQITVNHALDVPDLNTEFSKALVVELNKPVVETPVKDFRVMYKGMVTPSQLSMKVAARGFSYVHISLTSLQGKIDPESIKVQLERRNFTIKSKIEWGITDEDKKREIFYGQETSLNLGPTAEFKFSYNCIPVEGEVESELPGCDGFLIVEGEVDPKRSRETFQVTISTSASGLNNQVDLNQNKLSTTPFAVFVKVEEGNRVLKEIEKVEATFYLRDKSKFWTVLLQDNGLGTPDTFKNDGIYSGNFIAETDDTYSLFVTVTHTLYNETAAGSTLRDEKGSYDLNNAESRLLPINQKDVGYEIGHNAKVPSKNFIRVVDYSEPILIQNSYAWTGRIDAAQILDLTAWAVDDFNILLRWTSPFSIGKDLNVKSQYFDLRYVEADNTSLVELTEFNFEDVVEPLRLEVEKEPGEIQECLFDRAAPNTPYYFAIRSCISAHVCSRPSNIVGVRSRKEQLPTHPPLPTTAEPVESTLEVTISVTPTKETTTLSSTTQSASSTTRLPSTTEGITHWYEKPEGYITLSVFGGLLVLLGACALIYVALKNRMSKSEGRAQLID